MKLHNYHHYDHRGKKMAKKSHKLLKKMAKLEKKLSKYSFDNDVSTSDIDSSSCSDSTSRSRSHSRSRCKKRMGGRRNHRRARFQTLRGRSNSCSSSDSTSSGASSDASSRSPSAHHRHRYHGHHHQPSRHLSRSRSFAGRGCSPSGFQKRPHHHHRHPHSPHRHGRYWSHHYRRYQDGIKGCLFKMLARSEPNLQDPSTETQNDGNNENLVDLTSPPPNQDQGEHGPTAPSVEMEQDVPEGDMNIAEPLEGPVEGPEIDETLAKNWTEILKSGMPTEAKQALLKKYPVSKNCLLLKGPKINKEILHVTTEAAVEKDIMQMYTQNQIGTGLTALGQAITNLNNKNNIDENYEVKKILETLNEAAVIIADAHHNMTETRRDFMQPELKKQARSVVENCKTDEFLYGQDFGEKVKNIKNFKIKEKRSWKDRKAADGRCDKGYKRKHAEHDGDRRKSKRLDSLGPFKKDHCTSKVQ